jgi:hypothetical protein
VEDGLSLAGSVEKHLAGLSRRDLFRRLPEASGFRCQSFFKRLSALERPPPDHGAFLSIRGRRERKPGVLIIDESQEPCGDKVLTFGKLFGFRARKRDNP